MQNKTQEIMKSLSQLLIWAAEEMKHLANETQDAQMKTKYEQIAGVNRMLCEKLRCEQDEQSLSIGEREINLISRAYIIQKYLFLNASQISVEGKIPEIVDEICDKEIFICRDLLNEKKMRSDTQ